MSVFNKIEEREAESVETKPKNDSGLPSIGSENKDKAIGDSFTTSYVQKPRYEGGQDTTVRNEEREVVDRRHSEKALNRIMMEEITFRDWCRSVLYRLNNL